MGIKAFSIAICLAKCLTHNISAVIVHRVIVSKDHLQETIRWSFIGHVTYDDSDPKRSTSWPTIFEAPYLENCEMQTVGSSWQFIGNYISWIVMSCVPNGDGLRLEVLLGTNTAVKMLTNEDSFLCVHETIRTYVQSFVTAYNEFHLAVILD